MDVMPVRAATRVYGVAVRLLPDAFRARYGRELEFDFREIVLRAHMRRGVPGVIGATLGGVRDVLLSVMRERGRGGGTSETRELGQPVRGRRPQPGEAVMQWMTELRQAARALARRPGFTTAAVLTLGLGIGANVAIFAVVDAVLIRPLPYPESDAITLITHHAPGLNLPDLENSEGTLQFYRERANSFSAVARVETTEGNLTGLDRPARIAVAEVSPNIFDVLRTEPWLGRRFQPEDAVTAGPPRTAILTEQGWQTRFARDPDVVGRVIVLDGQPVEIVGVMPDGFRFPQPETELLVAREVDPNGRFGAFGIMGLARLKPGVPVEAAHREVNALQAHFGEVEADLSPAFLEQAQWTAKVERLRDAQVKDVRTALWIVFGAVGFVLLIASANVANLFLVRAEARHREIALRAAIGAGRRRLAWLFLSESLLLGAAGGAAGIAVAALAVDALVANGPRQLPRLHEVAVDARTMLFAIVVSLLVGTMFGLLAMLRYVRPGTGLVARESRGDTGSRERHMVRHALIAAQVALALVLLVGSGLMLRSFDRLRSVNPGFQPDGLLSIGVSVGGDRARSAPIYREILREAASLPGVRSAGLINAMPLTPSGLNGGSFDIESRPTPDGMIPPTSMWSVASHGLFEAMRIPLISGRMMEPRDSETPTNTAWVNQTFAKRHFPDGDALGQRIRLDGQTWLTIAGIVGDVRTFGMDEELSPMVYLPLSTTQPSTSIAVMNLAVRADVRMEAILPSIRSIIARVAPDAPITTARMMDEVVAESMAGTSFTMVVLGIAALVSLLLGAIGLYGVITYVVAQRTREIGVRVALGAAPGRVMQMVVRQGLIVVGIGLAIGIAAAFALTRLMESILFEVSARDPLTFVVVVAVLAGVSLAASYLPARRAALLSPLEALRTE